MNLDNLIENWQNIAPKKELGNSSIAVVSLQEQLKKQHQKQLKSNWITTVGFAFAISVMCWVMYSWGAVRGIFFSGSILAMITLMLVYLWVIWKNMSIKNSIIPLLDTLQYIDVEISKLEWRKKTISIYTPIYFVVLWSALMLYGADVTQEASWKFKVGYFGTTTAYTLAIYIIKYTKKGKKSINDIDSLLEELKSLKNELSK